MTNKELLESLCEFHGKGIESALQKARVCPLDATCEEYASIDGSNIIRCDQCIHDFLGREFEIPDPNEYKELFLSYRHVCGGLDPEKIGELVQAYKEGRVQIIPVCKGKECGACQHFQRISGTKRGKCEVKPYVESRCVSGKFPFEPSQSRKACLKFVPIESNEVK